MTRQEILNHLLQAHAAAFDEKEGMIFADCSRKRAGQSVIEKMHIIRDTVEFAAAALCSDTREYDTYAMQGLKRICDLQDLRTESDTYGLWAYTLEEDLEHMYVPDYNWANFVGKELIMVCLFAKIKLSVELEKRIRHAIRAAAECTIKRNVGVDYTNISIMGALTLVAAGEVLEDEKIFSEGKRRLSQLVEYTRFNTAFSEYNSSCYTVVALMDIGLMCNFFKDKECLKMAHELNFYGWEMMAAHYNACLEQLTPPQSRAYRDIDNGSLNWTIWQGTEGKYGHEPVNTKGIGLDMLSFPAICPQKCMPLFAEKESFWAHTYYKPNDIRKPGEDVTIIRELDSPALTAYSYRTPEYSMGVFALSDCWNQRRNAMVIWDKNHPKYIRLRGIMGDYDFCSGMTYAVQEKNCILGHLGLVSDRGRFHYITDKEMNGVYKTNYLGFCFEFGGETEQAGTVAELDCKGQKGYDYIIEDDTLRVHLHIETWVYDGRPAEVRLSSDGKRIELVGYEGEETVIDTNCLKDTYGVFTMEVEHSDFGAGSSLGKVKDLGETGSLNKDVDVMGKANAADCDVKVRIQSDGQIESDWKGLKVISPGKVVTYRRALGLSDKLQEQRTD